MHYCSIFSGISINNYTQIFRFILLSTVLSWKYVYICKQVLQAREESRVSVEDINDTLRPLQTTGTVSTPTHFLNTITNKGICATSWHPAKLYYPSGISEWYNLADVCCYSFLTHHQTNTSTNGFILDN